MTVVLLDVDNFKSINDTRGHAVGDMVLAALGRLLNRCSDETLHVGRWGGEEFVMLFDGMGVEDALARSEEIRLEIEAMEVKDEANERVPVTASFGVAEWDHVETADRVLERADKAMYAAKVSGRNRVASAQELPEVERVAQATVYPRNRNDTSAA